MVRRSIIRQVDRPLAPLQVGKDLCDLRYFELVIASAQDHFHVSDKHRNASVLRQDHAFRLNLIFPKDLEGVKPGYFEIDRDASMAFENVAVDGSSRMADSLMDAISPYSFSEARAFSTAYLTGFLADRYDEDSDKCSDRAKTRIESTALAQLRRSVTGYENVSVKTSNIAERDFGAHYALLPVWLLVNRYKGEAYTYAMNGQTGKFIGELPVSKKRFWLFTLALTLGIGALIAAVYFFILRGGM